MSVKFYCDYCGLEITEAIRLTNEEAATPTTVNVHGRPMKFHVLLVPPSVGDMMSRIPKPDVCLRCYRLAVAQILSMPALVLPISEINYDAGNSLPVDAVGPPLSGGMGKISPVSMTGDKP